MSHGDGREAGAGEDGGATAPKQQRIPGRKRVSAARTLRAKARKRWA